MTSPERFAELSSGLADGVRGAEPLVGLVLLGSSSEAGAARRDEWSDHDFFAVAAPGAGPRARSELDWLPSPERIVLRAREGELGFAALYDDGHLMEFAVAEPAELGGALATDATVAVDDREARVSALVEAARGAAAAADAFDAENDIRLALLKLLVGVGRARRGEVLSAGEFVRTWAVKHLVRAVRGRLGAASASAARDTIDPIRRFERDFPEWGDEIARALALPVEGAARRLFVLARRLEPGWEGFPREAADTVARRLGWEAAAGADAAGQPR